LSDSLIDPKEKLLIEYVISDTKVLSHAFGVFRPEYFFRPADDIVRFITEYFSEYKDVPSSHVLQAEFGFEFNTHEVTDSVFQYALDELEEFAKKRAIRNAIEQGIDLLQGDKYAAIEQHIRDALRVKLDSSLGLSYFDNISERIIESQEDKEAITTGITAIDDLAGKLKRKELMIVAAESGLGKTNIMINVMKNVAAQGYDCVFITLELSKEAVGERLDGMISGYPVKDLITDPDTVERDGMIMYPVKDLITDPDTVESEIKNKTQNKYGDIQIKYMPAETTASEIMAYLVEYQIQRGKYPDFIAVDYLDEMGSDDPNKQTIADRERDTTGRLRNIIVETNAYGLTAAQLTKDSADITKINRSHVSGGAYKVNRSDITLGVFATEEDIDNNMLNFCQIKVRSSQKIKKAQTAYINPKTLEITDNPISEKSLSNTNKLVSPKTPEQKVKEYEETQQTNETSQTSYDLLKKKLSARKALSI